MKWGEFGFKHKETGELHPLRIQTNDPVLLAANTPADHVVINAPADAPPATAEPAPTARDIALAQIRTLEASQHRAIREFLLLTTGGDRLREIEEAIKKLRGQLSEQQPQPPSP